METKPLIKSLGLCGFECHRPFSLNFSRDQLLYFWEKTIKRQIVRRRRRIPMLWKHKRHPFQSSFNVPFVFQRRNLKEKWDSFESVKTNLLSCAEIFAPHDFSELPEVRDTFQYSHWIKKCLTRLNMIGKAKKAMRAMKNHLKSMLFPFYVMNTWHSFDAMDMRWFLLYIYSS